MKRFGVLLASAALGAALVVSSPAVAFRGGGGFGGGGFHGGFGGGGFRGGMVTGRSVFVPGGNRFVGAPFAGRHAFVNRRFFDEGRRDRFEDRFRHRRFFVNKFDNFGSLACLSLTTTPRTGMAAGGGMAGSGLTSALNLAATIMATSTYSQP